MGTTLAPTCPGFPNAPIHAYLLVPCAVLQAAAPLRLLRAFAATWVRGHHEAVPCGPGTGSAGTEVGRRRAMSPEGAAP